MKNQITVALAVTLGLFAAACPAAAQDADSAAQLANMEQHLQGRGAKLTRVAEFTHDLRNGEDARDDVRLAGGADYLVMAACAQGCWNIDLIVRNDRGDGIGVDGEPDATPIVAIENARAGAHVVQTTMPACYISSCQARIRVYRVE